MKIQNIGQVEPDFLKDLRESMGLSLDKFWGAVGCARERGFRYESGKHEIPEIVKRLVFLQYGLGIPTDCQSDEFHAFAETLRAKDPNVGEVVRIIDRARALLTNEDQDQGDELV